MPDTILPGALTAREQREACRALKGQILRQETYALDGGPRSGDPYAVSERTYDIASLQPVAGPHHAAFFVHARETLDYHYERDPADPRVSHQLTLEVDDFGDVVRSAAVAYPRRPAGTGAHPKEQSATHIVLTENAFTDALDGDADYRTPMPSEVRTFELTGLNAAPGDPAFLFKAIDDASKAATEIAYEELPHRPQTPNALRADRGPRCAP